MAAARLIGFGLVALLGTWACEGLTPPTVACVQIDAAECRRQADAIIEATRRERPSKRIVSIRITKDDGMSVQYDDGTGMEAIP